MTEAIKSRRPGHIHLHIGNIGPGLVLWLRKDAQEKDPIAFKRSNLSIGALDHPAVVLDKHEDQKRSLSVTICVVSGTFRPGSLPLLSRRPGSREVVIPEDLQVEPGTTPLILRTAALKMSKTCYVDVADQYVVSLQMLKPLRRGEHLSRCMVSEASLGILQMRVLQSRRLQASSDASQGHLRGMGPNIKRSMSPEGYHERDAGMIIGPSGADTVHKQNEFEQHEELDKGKSVGIGKLLTVLDSDGDASDPNSISSGSTEADTSHDQDPVSTESALGKGNMTCGIPIHTVDELSAQELTERLLIEIGLRWKLIRDFECLQERIYGNSGASPEAETLQILMEAVADLDEERQDRCSKLCMLRASEKRP